jgi:hypothetical protein
LRIQSIMEQADELLLQVPVQIDQQIAAADQIQIGERRVLDDVLLGKDQQIADGFPGAIEATVLVQGKKRVSRSGETSAAMLAGKMPLRARSMACPSMSVAKICTL